MEKQKQIVVFQRGSISPKDKEKLSKNGFLPIESDNPDSFKIMLPMSPKITADDILESALIGIKHAGYDSPYTYMAKAISQKIVNRCSSETK